MSLVVVSNRLPIVVAAGNDGRAQLKPGAGGLVTALRPVLRDRGGTWVGWPGASEAQAPGLDEALGDSTGHSGYRLGPVWLSPEERDLFYCGFSNEVIWPLFHDSASRCNFDSRYWETYVTVNRKFAEATARYAGAGDFIWVHDYHLIDVARALRERFPDAHVAFFLHIPFPSLDLFLQLPWRFQLLRSLLEYDLIGFQTTRDRRNFMQCVRALLKDAEVSARAPISSVSYAGREARTGVFPIGIDFNEFARSAAQPAVVRKMETLRSDETNRTILLGVDRLDYTKGIPNKLRAFRRLLEAHPELRGRVTLLQVVVPSRESIPDYHDFKGRLERLVGEINGEFTRSGWVPVHYIFRAFTRTNLLAYYRAADIALVTPLKDGMNLVAKEYCAANVSEDGVLILSEFAGAAAQLQAGALLVNPYDEEGVAEAIARAVWLPVPEREARMRKLRRTVRDANIYGWLDSFLRAAFSRDLSNFPQAVEYLPRDEEADELFAD